MLKVTMFVLTINSGDYPAVGSREFDTMDSCVIAAIIANDIAIDTSRGVVHICEYVEILDV